MESREWIKVKDGIAEIGLTKSAIEEIGEIVYIELPEVGKKIKENEEVCILESSKAAMDLCSPLAGEIIAVNDDLKKLNEDPENSYLFVLRIE